MMFGFFLMADIGGFKKIILNNSEEDINRRIEEWVKLVDEASSLFQISSIQLISDSLFASTSSSVENLKALVSFGRYPLEKGVQKSLPIRGAITHGSFEWGRITYGKAVVRAYELESAQNWIGICCDNRLPHLEELWGADSIVCYPPPMKSGVVLYSPVVVWDVPDAKTLAILMSKGGLMKDGEPMS